MLGSVPWGLSETPSPPACSSPKGTFLCSRKRQSWGPSGFGERGGQRRCPWLIQAWHQPEACRPDNHGLFGKSALRIPGCSTEGKQLSSGSWPPSFVYFPSIFMPVKILSQEQQLGMHIKPGLVPARLPLVAASLLRPEWSCRWL